MRKLFLEYLIKQVSENRESSDSNNITNKHLGNYIPRQNEWEQQQVERSPFTKQILIVDDNPDITITFKKALAEENRNDNNGISFQVNAYNDPLLALIEFRPDFYDLMLVDINMPKMNGFEFSTKVLELDVNPRICYMSSGLINQEALREQYPTLSIGCFIKKPVTIEYLVRRVKAELE
jgi:DNA-binding response OmpR family regulator